MLSPAPALSSLGADEAQFHRGAARGKAARPNQHEERSLRLTRSTDAVRPRGSPVHNLSDDIENWTRSDMKNWTPLN